MEEARSLRFAEAVRRISVATRATGWTLPSFRSPPGVEGSLRTIRRRMDGSYAVAVALHGRPWPAVQADLIEGVVVANSLLNAEADRCRETLWRYLLEGGTYLAAA